MLRAEWTREWPHTSIVCGCEGDGWKEEERVNLFRASNENGGGGCGGVVCTKNELPLECLAKDDFCDCVGAFTS